MKKNTYLGLFLILFCLILKFVEIILSEQVNADGPWSLSQCVSMLNGDWGWSRFSHELDGRIYYNFCYSIFYFIPFKIFGISFQVYVISYFFYILSTILSFYLIFNKRNFIAFLFSISLVLSTYTYNFRYELFGILLISWGLWFLIQSGKWFWIGLFLFAWASLIHPATLVVVFSILLLYIYYIDKLFNFKFVFFVFTFLLFNMFLLLGFNYHNYIDSLFIRPEFKQRFMVIKFENFPKWILLAGTTFFLIIKSFKKTLGFPLFVISMNIIIFLMFKKSYYYPYLILHLILVFYFNLDLYFNSHLKRIIIIHTFLFLAIFSIFPIFKIFENRKYFSLIHRSTQYLKNKTIHDKKNGAIIYVERDLAFGLFDYYYCRMYLYEYQNYFFDKPRIKLGKNDKIFIFHNKEINRVRENPDFVLGSAKFEIIEIEKPVRGLLTLGGPRTDSIGFWEIRLKK
jgi:hypothetical protein